MQRQAYSCTYHQHERGSWGKLPCPASRIGDGHDILTHLTNSCSSIAFKSDLKGETPLSSLFENTLRRQLSKLSTTMATDHSASPQL